MSPPTDDFDRGDSDPGRVFRHLCRQGRRPDVRGFLDRQGTLTPPEIASILRIDQLERWEAGDRVAARDYLRSFEALRDDPEAALEVVYGEYLLREERGESPTLEEYLADYPELADRLRMQVELHRALETLDGVDGPSAPTAADTPTDWPGRGHFRPDASSGSTCPAGYEILGLLGRGGMGVVYRARQVKLGRRVALKMIVGGEHAGPVELARFQIEAESVARLQHPNIVQIYEVGEHGGRPFVALELVDGGSLEQRMAGKPMPAA